MSIQPAWQHDLSFFGTPVLVEPSRGQLSSDAGLLPIREFDQRIGLTQAVVDALDDPRDPDLIEHTFGEMVRARVYGILAGYEDQNDHDTLRTDPVFKLLAGRLPSAADLASQPTLSRFENAVSIRSLKRLRDVFIDQFIASFPTPPRHLTFDLDAVDDPAHGHQQLTLWHGYYDQNQYLPLVITCADNDQLVMVSLRPGNAHAALGADDDLRYLVRRLRQAWPDVVIDVRGDCGFGVPHMYAVSEDLRLYYTFGLSSNAVLRRQTEDLLAQAVATFEQHRQAARQAEPPRAAAPARLFASFWYQAGTWAAARYVVAKAEANAQGTNRRFVVSNRPGAMHVAEPTYDAYAARGESENRNKEYKNGLAMDRLSDHRFVANYFRLYLHAAALNLLVRLRRAIADPPAAVPAVAAPAAAPVGGVAGAAPVVGAAPQDGVPVEALAGAQRQQYFRQRRQRDPLGEGQPCTWRTLLIKVAAEVVVSARRVVVRLSSSWPHLGWYQRVCERLRGPLPAAAPHDSG
jgi:Transposase DDE domain group 1